MVVPVCVIPVIRFSILKNTFVGPNPEYASAEYLSLQDLYIAQTGESIPVLA